MSYTPPTAAPAITVSPAFIDPTHTDGELLIRKATSVTSLSVLFIGDSITLNNPGGGTPPTKAATDLSINGLTITAINAGVTGTSTSDWAPSSTNDLAALALFTPGMAVSIMLGTNDARAAVRNSAATYTTNLLAIVAAWVTRGASVIWLHNAPYCVPGSNSGDQDATANTLRLAYAVKNQQIANGVKVLQGDTQAYAYFAANSGELSDGIHPTSTGATHLAQFWATAMQPGISTLTQQTTLQRATLGANLSVATVSGVQTISAIDTASFLAIQTGSSMPPIPLWSSDGTNFVYTRT